MISSKTFKREDLCHLITFFTGLFLNSQDYDSQYKKVYITHFFLPLHPGNSPFPMRVCKKSTIGIISNHSLQHLSGYYFLCDSMYAGGLSGWNGNWLHGDGIVYAVAFVHSTQLLNEIWLYQDLFLSLTHELYLFVMKCVSLFVTCGRFLYFTQCHMSVDSIGGILFSL